MFRLRMQKRLALVLLLAVALGTALGCQGNGNFPTELSTVTPYALLQINTITQRLDSALQVAAGNTAVTSSLQATRSRIGIPQQFLSAFTIKATTINRSQSGFNLIYTSDDLFTPLATWRVTISGGQFGSTPQTLMGGHVNSDGTVGDYSFNLTNLGDPYLVEWTNAANGVLTLKLTVGNQSSLIIAINPDGHGSVTNLTSTTNF